VSNLKTCDNSSQGLDAFFNLVFNRAVSLFYRQIQEGPKVFSPGHRLFPRFNVFLKPAHSLKCFLGIFRFIPKTGVSHYVFEIFELR
jgi:hypothetical protein